MKLSSSFVLVLLAVVVACVVACEVNQGDGSASGPIDRPRVDPGDEPVARLSGAAFRSDVPGEAGETSGVTASEAAEKKQTSATRVSLENLPEPKPIAPFVQKAIEWLVKAQHSNGGWGSGSHARQGVRDPHAVPTDPATTAFTAMALLRAGGTPVSGQYRDALRRATEYMAGVVEESSSEGPQITDLKGTQPQQKLGPQVDTAIAAQFFSRVLTTLPPDGPPADRDLRERVDAALEKCLAKLQTSQHKNGSWGKGGWAPVFQSSFGGSALEMARAVGKEVDEEVLEKARAYQKGNYSTSSGRALGADSAGVELYAFASSQRATAGQARAAVVILNEAKRAGKLDSHAEVSVANFSALGVDAVRARSLSLAYSTNSSQLARLSDETLLKGFGNNGGEEYLSYLFTSESLVITGGEPWEKWNAKMHERLGKIQNPDGSWAGHHCITSPVFCTAAAVQCLSADRDASLLLKISEAELTSSRDR